MEQIELYDGAETQAVQVGTRSKNVKYEDFVDKFKPKKTTDDCYTPPVVYEAIAKWVADNYGIYDTTFVRPFYPGGDYKNFDYPEGCVVVDNPPFSILAQILVHYHKTGIRFFLFAPTLTMFSKISENYTCLPTGGDITYENGAVVSTSFVTNLEDTDIKVRTYPDLYQAIKKANEENLRAVKKHLPKYSYPDNVLTAAMAYRYSQYGVEYTLRSSDCVKIEALDSQRAKGKTIFGKGFLLSDRAAADRAAADRAAADRAAADRAAADRAAADRWQLSERELAIIKSLGTPAP